LVARFLRSSVLRSSASMSSIRRDVSRACAAARECSASSSGVALGGGASARESGSDALEGGPLDVRGRRVRDGMGVACVRARGRGHGRLYIVPCGRRREEIIIVLGPRRREPREGVEFKARVSRCIIVVPPPLMDG
jgi:hypothetical protein